MSAETLLSLAKRVEKASRSDRSLDWEIHLRDGLANVGAYGSHPRYTASLDAAMTLVPEGWRIGQLEENWRSGRWQCHVTQRPSAALIRAFDAGKTIGYDSKDSEAATPALTLCATALRALAEQVAA